MGKTLYPVKTAVSRRPLPLGTFRNNPSGEERGEMAVFAGY